MQKYQQKIEKIDSKAEIQIQSSEIIHSQGFISQESIPEQLFKQNNNQPLMSQKDKQAMEVFYKSCVDFQTKQIVFQTLSVNKALMVSKRWQQRTNMRQKNIITLIISKPSFQNQDDKDRFIQLFQHFKSIRLVLGQEVFQNKQVILHQDNNTFYEGTQEFMVIYWQDERKRYIGQTKAIKQDQTYIPEGQGFLKHIVGKHLLSYLGYFKNGVRDGLGKEFRGHTYKYQGQWKDDIKNGKGQQIFLSRKKVKSTNTIKLVQKSSYSGQFAQGKREGQGIQKGVDGVYQGQWHQGFKHGKGKIQYTNGDIYDGDWCQGRRQGKGTYQEDVSSAYHKEKGARLNTYVGDFKDGVYHGTGTMTYADESTYQGQWQLNKRNGKGLNKWKDGDYYDGSWLKGMAHGSGQSLINDIYYDGQFYLGNKNGLGQQTDLEGNTLKGIWDKGVLVKKIMVNGQEIPQDQQNVVK